jgi:hypothetical protein
MAITFAQQGKQANPSLGWPPVLHNGQDLAKKN